MKRPFRDMKEGTVVTRMLCGEIPMNLRITQVTKDKIICGAWEFDRNTGFEIDEYISVLVSHLLPKALTEEELKAYERTSTVDTED